MSTITKAQVTFAICAFLIRSSRKLSWADPYSHQPSAATPPTIALTVVLPGVYSLVIGVELTSSKQFEDVPSRVTGMFGTLAATVTC